MQKELMWIGLLIGIVVCPSVAMTDFAEEQEDIGITLGVGKYFYIYVSDRSGNDASHAYVEIAKWNSRGGRWDRVTTAYTNNRGVLKVKLNDRERYAVMAIKDGRAANWEGITKYSVSKYIRLRVR